MGVLFSANSYAYLWSCGSRQAAADKACAETFPGTHATSCRLFFNNAECDNGKKVLFGYVGQSYGLYAIAEDGTITLLPAPMELEREEERVTNESNDELIKEKESENIYFNAVYAE